MSLAVGDKLGSYEILAPIGAGGMGEVYRARDTKLKRDVALKVLPEAFAADPERMARFQREAEVLASLNHPNIAAIYGVEDRALVMELVEGDSPKGPMPFDDAWKITSQIAATLEYAHEKGVVHRDLKPANVKVTPEGVVKLLDFGLAKAFTAQPPVSGSLDNSPTLTLGATQVGMILGTAAYMAPEQAKGRVVDKRADIWAFGVLLYELLTGERLFKGEDTSDTLAQVLTKEPDLERAPVEARKLLRRCLEKDPRLRLRDIGDAGDLLIEKSGTEVVRQRTKSSAPLGAAIGVLALALAALSFLHFRETPPVARVTRLQIPLPEKAVFGGRMALSPDGRRLAFTSTGSEGGVWVRDLDSLEARLLPDTRNAFNAFWSPDNRFLAFGVGTQLKVVNASGGFPQTLCESPSDVGSGAWNRDGVIIFGDANNGQHLRRVSATGGVPSDLTVTDGTRGELFHALPSFLPDGKHFVYYVNSLSPETTGIYVGSLDAKPEQQSRKRLLASQFSAVYAAGRLIFMRQNTLMAQAFDAAKLKLEGDAMPVAEQVQTFLATGTFSVSGAVLAYRTGSSGVADRQLTWFDPQGKVLSTAGEPGAYTALSLSPDGARAAIVRTLFAVTGDIWLHDFARGVSTRFTFDGTAGASVVSKGPVWSPDGDRIVFRVTRGEFPGNLSEKASNGAGEETALLQSAEAKEPNEWSHDGRFLLYSEQDPKTNYDLMVLPLSGDRKPIPLLRTPFAEMQGTFSHDTRWFAYVSNESGRNEIYVQPFTPPAVGSSPVAGKWQVSRDGGTRPKWRADGKEIFFRALNGSPMTVDVSTSPAFQAGIPKQLFALPANVGDWDVTSDGKRLLVAMPLQSQQSANTPITVVLNWEVALKK